MSSNDLLDKLEAQKPQFVRNAQSEVHSYVVRQRRRTCTSIVEKDAHGPDRSRTHRPGVDSYLAVLICFCTKQKYKGHELDSALSEPVIEIVCKCYSELLNENSEHVKEYFHEKIAGNRVVLQEMTKIVVTKLCEKGIQISQQKLAKMFHEAVAHVLHDAVDTKTAMAVGHGVAIAACSPAGLILANMLLQAISHHITYIMALAMKNSIIVTAVKVIAKKLCLAAITGVVVKTLAIKFGITKAASALHTIGWVFIGGYLMVKLKELPKEMAEKISKGVRDTLNDSYRTCLEHVLDNLAQSALDPKKLAATMVSELTDVSGLQKKLEAGVDFSNPDLPRLEKEAEELLEEEVLPRVARTGQMVNRRYS